MKLVTWNCLSGRPHDKAEVLAPLDADVIVLQECARPDAVRSESCLWAGSMNHKGLAVIARPPYRLCAGPVESDDTGSFLPCIVSAPVHFNLLAVWTHPTPSYLAEMYAALDRYGAWIRERPTVIAGDFNSHPQWDRPGGRHTHKGLQQRLREEFGLVSAWHAAHPGTSEPATLYQRYRGEHRTFHIDYCFIPEAWTSRLRSVSVGSFEEYDGKSDHRPVAIDVELEPRPGPGARAACGGR